MGVKSGSPNLPWPSYVAWWVEDGQKPAGEDAAKRLELLHDEGSTPHAFDFKTPFDADGQPIILDRHKITDRSRAVKAFDDDNPNGL